MKVCLDAQSVGDADFNYHKGLAVIVKDLELGSPDDFKLKAQKVTPT